MKRQFNILGRSTIAGLLLSFLSSGSANAQTAIKVTRIDNSVNDFIMDTSGKFLFSSGNILIYINNLSAATTIPLNDIRKITFDYGSTLIKTSEVSENVFKIYPNPTSSYFEIVTPIKQKIAVRMYNTQGVEVLNNTYESGNKIDISNLSSGIYVVIINQQSFKLIKK